MTEPRQGPSLGDVVSAAAFVVGLITAWLYVAGWTYAYAYFDQFRIPLMLTDLPKEHIFVYGGLTLWKNPLAAVGVFGAAAAVAALCIRLRARLGRSWLVAIMVVSIAALFGLARMAGSATALSDVARQRATDYAAYPRVLIGFGTDTDLSDAQRLASGGCARLLLSTGDRMFLIVPRAEMPALELNTLVIPSEDVVSVTISNLASSCP